MSSHHIIKDNQEPALWIVGNDIDSEIFNQLLGWTPLIYVNEDCLSFTELLGIKVDYVLADLSSPIELKDIAHQNPVSLLKGDNHQKIRDSLKSQNQSKLLIVGLDESKWSEEKRKLESDFEISFYSGSSKGVLPHSSFKKWVPQGTKLKVIEGQLLHSTFHEKNGWWEAQKDAIISFKDFSAGFSLAVFDLKS